MSTPALNPTVRKIVLDRLRLRQARERQQRQLIPDTDIHHQTIVGKLAGLTSSNQYWNLVKCGDEKIFQTCRSCGKVHEYSYRCCLKWCPRCQWKVTKEREKMVAAWAQRIRQPKHLVLTQKNFPTLTPKVLKNHLACLRKFRRLACFADVRGGCVSVELTRGEGGWHLHSHWLLDVDWLDMPAVSVGWGGLVGQAFAIVKVKDVRAGDYVQELIKYLAKGSDIAAWPPEILLEFVTAIRGKRFFFSFGQLFHMGAEIRRQLAADRPEKSACECGSLDFCYETEQQAVINQIRRERRK